MNNQNAHAFADTGRPQGDPPQAIHTTLPMTDLIGIFESEISEIVSYDSFEYENTDSATHFFRGKPRLHKCQYRLNVAKLEMGYITLTRNTPFAERELSQIESLLGVLSRHLHNALEYQAGLDDRRLDSLQADHVLSAMD